MPDEHSFPESADPNTNPWLTDKVVSSIQGPDITPGRDREAVRTNRDEAYLRLQFESVYVRMTLRIFNDFARLRPQNKRRLAAIDANFAPPSLVRSEEKPDRRFGGLHSPTASAEAP
jgi:hypothetical protein